jgi:hypothetical protein
MGVVVEGGSPAQRRVLGEILAGLGESSLELVRLREWEQPVEGEPAPTPEEMEASRGTAIEIMRPAPAGVRAWWELHLAGYAYDFASRAAGLTRVVWLGNVRGEGDRVGELLVDRPALSADDVAALRRDVESAAREAGAALELEVLRPRAHALAAVLRADEPHALVRRGLPAFLGLVHPWVQRCAGRYVEVQGPAGELLVEICSAGGWGMSATAREVLCCSPSWGLSSPIDAPPRPRCPVFG